MKIVSRKYLLPLNFIIFNICRLIPCRNKKLWVFGAHAGNKFDDNSRFLFEYVNKNKDRGIRPVWLAYDRKTIEQLKKDGYEAYNYRSIKGIVTSFRAGVAFYTHSLYDLGAIPLVGGAKIVALWHGVGFKRIYNAKYSGWKLTAKKIIDKLFTRTYRNVTIATSEYTKKQWAEAFNVKMRNIYITGQPRNDVFRKETKKNELLKETSIDINRRIVLFMPTYRSSAQSKGTIQSQLNDLFNSIELSNVLDRMHCVLVVKLHPLTPFVYLPKRSNFMVLSYESIDCNQELLSIADILITDYSSCFVDFALTKRPIIFYQPDYEEYIKYSGRNEKEFEEFAKLNIAHTPEELACKLITPDNNVSLKANEIFEAAEIRNTCYCSNVYKLIIKLLKLDYIKNEFQC